MLTDDQRQAFAMILSRQDQIVAYAVDCISLLPQGAPGLYNQFAEAWENSESDDETRVMALFAIIGFFRVSEAYADRLANKEVGGGDE